MLLCFAVQEDEEWIEIEEEGEKDYSGLRVQNLQISCVSLCMLYTSEMPDNVRKFYSNEVRENGEKSENCEVKYRQGKLLLQFSGHNRM